MTKKQNKQKYREVIINTCYGGFGLSDEAYEELIKMGVPVRKYITEKENPKTGLYDIKEPNNEGKVIFDKELTPLGEDKLNDLYWKFKGDSNIEQRYWEVWSNTDRENPLLIAVIKKLGAKANSWASKLKIVKIPADVDYTIEEYDGMEWIAEEHKTWN